MPGRRTEPELKPRATFLALTLITLLGPATLRAQQERRAAFDLEPAAGVTALRDQPSAFGGGSGLLDLGGPVRFGGAGWILFDTPRLPGGAAGYDLHVAYGGVLLEAPLAARSRATLSARLLLGVGNAKVSVPVAATLLGADNFGVVEPEIHASLGLSGTLAVTVGASFRATFGVEDLPGVAPADLRGASVRAGLSFRTF